MTEDDGALTCLECGQPITDGVGLVCLPRCAAVIRLVRYGRTHGDRSLDADDADRLNRLRREAEVLGHFPSSDAITGARQRDRRHCQFQGCSEREVEFIDWRSADPDLSRVVRADDLRTLCAVHQHDEAVRRFIGPLGQTARTAPAVWARMTAVQPLVLRDNEALWKSPRTFALLTNWPLDSSQTRRDFDAWISALLAAGSASRAEDAGSEVEPDGIEAWMNRALDSLALPVRRRDRVIRALDAWLLRLQADEATMEAARRMVNRDSGLTTTRDAP
jgi:hypothetical protein